MAAKRADPDEDPIEVITLEYDPDLADEIGPVPLDQARDRGDVVAVPRTLLRRVIAQHNFAIGFMTSTLRSAREGVDKAELPRGTDRSEVRDAIEEMQRTCNVYVHFMKETEAKFREICAITDDEDLDD